jgi:hypothetical protein
VYGRLDDGNRDAGGRVVVSGLALDERGALVVRESSAIPWAASRTGLLEASRECRLRVAGSDLVQSTPDGEIVLLRAPLRIGTSWTRPVVGYLAESGAWRGEVHCRIAMIESVPVFGETRVTLRVMGTGRIPLGDVVLVEQHAAGIGLVLRREQVGAFAAFETVLDEIREEPRA